MIAWFQSEGLIRVTVSALYLAPFAGIAFLWFIGVVRDRVGIHEDKLFSTVFLGSGLLFVGMYWSAAAQLASLVTGNRFDASPPLSSEALEVRSSAFAYPFVLARAAAAFMLAPEHRTPVQALRACSHIGFGIASHAGEPDVPAPDHPVLPRGSRGQRVRTATEP